jgi:hypothetical protein
MMISTSKHVSEVYAPVEYMHKSSVSVSFHDHLLISQLLSNILSAAATHFNPSLTEQSTASQYEH